MEKSGKNQGNLSVQKCGNHEHVHKHVYTYPHRDAHAHMYYGVGYKG